MPNNLIRICHVTSVHPYKDGRIFRKECQSLAKKYDVSLIAPNVESKEEEGIHIYGVELPKERFKRMRNLDIVFRKMIEVDAEVYHFHDPELIPLGYKAKKIGKKAIFDSHEDVPLQISEKGWIPKPFRKLTSSVYRKYEEGKLHHYDALVSVTPSIVDRLKGCNPNTYQITNYPILKEFKDNRTWQNRICFTGGISAQWMHHNVIESIENIDVKYVVAGIVEGDYLMVLKSQPAWSKVDYKGVVTPIEVSEIQQSSFAGIALNDYVANVGFKLGSLGNTKLFEYMMSGIPVIATDFILWKEIIEKYECGICVNPQDVDAIRDAIMYLKNNPEEAKKMGDNGRKAVQEQYNWTSQESILFGMYDKVLNS
jgi:glycosyltransferase involved in cell wall biosynthesis